MQILDTLFEEMLDETWVDVEITDIPLLRALVDAFCVIVLKHDER